MKTGRFVIVALLSSLVGCTTAPHYTGPNGQPSADTKWNPFAPNFNAPARNGLGYQPQSETTQPLYGSTRTRGSIYSTDYTVDNTLGGNTRISDRFGNSTTFDKTLGGNLRATSNTGKTTTFSQNLGGGYSATSSGGTTYRADQNLGGGYRVNGSDGSRYQGTQMLGGGTRYDRY
jgi:hypothetical protein